MILILAFLETSVALGAGEDPRESTCLLRALKSPPGDRHRAILEAKSKRKAGLPRS